MRRFMSALIIGALVVLAPAAATGADNCHGEFPDLVGDICWDCFWPLKIGSSTLAGREGDGISPGGDPPPICFCGSYIIGLGISFWAPARVAEATTRAFCSPTLGGKQLASKSWVKRGTQQRDNEKEEAFYHVHWMYFPLMSWFDLLMSEFCGTSGASSSTLSQFDVGMLSELEPTWGDDELAMIINPEAALFATPVLEATCAADCIAATTYQPLDFMFWCAGCEGSLYPMGGNVKGIESGLDAGLLAIMRMHAKMHRSFIAWDWGSADALCGPNPAFFIPRSLYKTQMIYPRPVTDRAYPYGHATATWGAGREYPVKGEDFAHIIWQRRVCCLL